mmetsp:Transcript_12555/g.24525  ORF Transcript_12555/g.24525 Transcript_12555/m.24525 type:complete len:246 (+) Transcript_12555:3719-4456(+)
MPLTDLLRVRHPHHWLSLASSKYVLATLMSSVSSSQLPPESALPINPTDAAMFVLVFCCHLLIRLSHICVSASLHARMSSLTLAARATSKIASSTPLSACPVSMSMPWVAVSIHLPDRSLLSNPRRCLSSASGVSMSGMPPAKSGLPSSCHIACNAASSSAPVANPTRSVLPWQHIATVLKVPCSLSKSSTVAERAAGTDWKSHSAVRISEPMPMVLTAALSTSLSSTSELISKSRFCEESVPEK